MNDREVSAMRYLVLLLPLLLIVGCMEQQSSSEKKPDIAGKIVVTVDELKVDPFMNAYTVRGKVKNFSDTTLQSLSLRFTFLDKNKQTVHTETRHIFVLDRFRPNDVKSYSEVFFNLPKGTQFVRVEVEDFLEAW